MTGPIDLHESMASALKCNLDHRVAPIRDFGLSCVRAQQKADAVIGRRRGAPQGLQPDRRGHAHRRQVGVQPHRPGAARPGQEGFIDGHQFYIGDRTSDAEGDYDLRDAVSSPAAVPEPAIRATMIAGVGMAGAALRRPRRRKRIATA